MVADPTLEVGCGQRARWRSATDQTTRDVRLSRVDDEDEKSPANCPIRVRKGWDGRTGRLLAAWTVVEVSEGGGRWVRKERGGR
jgi:hypothetical protein